MLLAVISNYFNPLSCFDNDLEFWQKTNNKIGLSVDDQKEGQLNNSRVKDNGIQVQI